MFENHIIPANNEGDKLLPPDSWHRGIWALPGIKHPDGRAWQTGTYIEKTTGIPFHLMSMREENLIEGMSIGVYLVVHMSPENYKPIHDKASFQFIKFFLEKVLLETEDKPDIEAPLIGNLADGQKLQLGDTAILENTNKLWNNGPLFRFVPLRVSEAQDIFRQGLKGRKAKYLPF